MKELVLTVALFSLLICGVLCQDRGSSRYVPSSGDEDYDDSPQGNAPPPPPPPRRNQQRRVRPNTRPEQSDREETQRRPPVNTRVSPSSPSRNIQSGHSQTDGYPSDRAPSPPRSPPQRPHFNPRQQYGSEDSLSDQKSPHQQDAHLDTPAASPRPSRRRRPSKRLRNEKTEGGDDGVQDKPRTRDHQPSRSNSRVLDDDTPSSHRYQSSDDTFPSGDMQRLSRPTPKADQENKKIRDKPRNLPRPPHSRYPPHRQDEEKQIQNLPIRRPVLEHQPAVNRLPDEQEGAHRGLPDSYHASGSQHGPPVHPAGQQDRPYVNEPDPPQSRPTISDNSYEVPEEPLPRPPHKSIPVEDFRQPHRSPYPVEANNGGRPNFEEQAIRNEPSDNRNYRRNTRAHHQTESGVSESSPQVPSFPLKDNAIHRTADRGQSRNIPIQREAQPSGGRRNALPQQRDSVDRNYDPSILKQNSDQNIRENTGRRIHAPSESEVRLPPNRPPLIAPEFDIKEEPKTDPYRYSHEPELPSSPYAAPTKDFEEPHSEAFAGLSDRLPDGEKTERHPEYPQKADGLPFANNFDAPHHIERPGVEFADNVASLEASAEAEVDRQIRGPAQVPPQPPSNRLPVENAEEDSVAHIFPPPRLQHESRSNVRSPQPPRIITPPARDTRTRQNARDSRSPQNIRDQRSPSEEQDSRSRQRGRDSTFSHDARETRTPQSLRDSSRYRETSSSRSRYDKDLPDADTRHDSRPQRVGSRYHNENPEVPDADTRPRPQRAGSRYNQENPEEVGYNQRRATSHREESVRPSGANQHRSRPQYEGDSRRSPPPTEDPEERYGTENQRRPSTDRQRQSYPPNPPPRNNENRRPQYNAPPQRDHARPTERRDPERPRTNFKCPEQYGFFADRQQCDKYYECRNGTATESICMDGLAFNEISAPKFLRCDSLRDVDCSSRSELQPPQPSKNCPRRFGLYAHETDCTKFWNCVDGAATEVQCPPGLVYSDARATCDWADLVENTCKSEDLLGFTCPEATSAELQDGVYSRHPHPSDCRLHFTCIKGVDGTRRPRMLSCNDGTVFDQQSGQCTRAENVPGCENYYGVPARSTKPQPSSEETEDAEPKVSRRRRPNKRTRGRSEDRY